MKQHESKTTDLDLDLMYSGLQINDVYRDGQHVAIVADNPIYAWINGLQHQEGTIQQCVELASMKSIYPCLAVMANVHTGIVPEGVVVCSKTQIIPMMCTDIGCGTLAIQTSLRAPIPDLATLRSVIELAVPHGGRLGNVMHDKGMWSQVPRDITEAWALHLQDTFNDLCECCPDLKDSDNVQHLGTVGSGHHSIQLCVDTDQFVWILVRSGSRGIGSRINRVYRDIASVCMEQWQIELKNNQLCFLPQGTEEYKNYVNALQWAMKYGTVNRQLIAQRVLEIMMIVLNKDIKVLADIDSPSNTVSYEHHFGQDLLVCRKGAINVPAGHLGVITGVLGQDSYIVQGKGCDKAFDSCGASAGRYHRDTTIQDLQELTKDIECRKDHLMLDELVTNHKDMEQVLNAQQELVLPITKLRQIMYIRG